MAVALLSSATHDSGSATNAASPQTWTQEATAGANRLLLVLLAFRAGTQPTVSTVTYGGQAMTEITGSPADNSSGGGVAKVHGLYLNETGIVAASNTTVSATYSGASSLKVVGISRLFSGVDQSAPLGTWAEAGSASGTTVTVNVSSATGELVVDVVAWGTANLGTVGAGQTDVVQDATSHGTDVTGSSSLEAGAATVTMSWTAGGAGWVIGAVPLKPAASIDPAILRRLRARRNPTIGIGQRRRMLGVGAR